jgi:hypothetical protein
MTFGPRDGVRAFVRACAAQIKSYTKEGIEALVFTAEGDMRLALNNLQSTVRVVLRLHMSTCVPSP